uniref:Uncharacterized protein n=1 Tax=Kalanchoe fedtschenkoi TaxID=63787 RepID=A0A7N0UQ30_KALFE
MHSTSQNSRTAPRQPTWPDLGIWPDLREKQCEVDGSEFHELDLASSVCFGMEKGVICARSGLFCCGGRKS